MPILSSPLFLACNRSGAIQSRDPHTELLLVEGARAWGDTHHDWRDGRNWLAGGPEKEDLVVCLEID